MSEEPPSDVGTLELEIPPQPQLPAVIPATSEQHDYEVNKVPLSENGEINLDQLREDLLVKPDKINPTIFDPDTVSAIYSLDETYSLIPFIFSTFGSSLPPQDKELFNAALEFGELLPYAELFSDLDEEAAAEEAINNGYADVLIENLDRFPSLDRNKLAMQIVESNNWASVDALLDHIDEFPDLDKDKLSTILFGSPQGRLYILDYIDLFPNVNQTELALRVMNYDSILLGRNLPRLPKADHKVIADAAFMTNNVDLLAAFLNEFPEVDQQKLANMLFYQDRQDLVLEYFTEFTDLDKKELASRLIEEGFAQKMVERGAVHFPGADLKELADHLIDRHMFQSLINDIDDFPDLDHKYLAQKVIDEGKAYLLLPVLDKFPDIDKLAFAQTLIDYGISATVALNINKFGGLETEIGKRIIESGKPHVVAANIERFPGLDKQYVVDKVMEGVLYEPPRALIYKRSIFGSCRIPLSKIKSLVTETSSFEDIAVLYDTYSDEKWPDFEATREVFGEFASSGVLQAIESINSGQLTDELRDLGINSTGQRGIQQLRERAKKLSIDLVDPEKADELEALIAKSSIARSVLMQLVHYDSSDFGLHGEESFLRVIQSYSGVPVEKRRLISDAYTTADFRVSTTEVKDTQSEKGFDKDAIERYQRLRQQLVDAVDLLEDSGPRPFGGEVDKLNAYLADKVKTLSTQVSRLKNEGKDKAADKVAQQLTAVSSILGSDLRKLSAFEDNFIELAKDKKLHDDLSKILFAWALRRPPSGFDLTRLQQIEENIRSLPVDPTIDAVSFVTDQVDHVINQEVFRQYFKSDEARRSFEDMTSTKALQVALSKSQSSLTTSGSVQMRFEPTRGLLMELSGHVADACWASTYSSISEIFPNMTAVMIRQSPDTKYDRLAGAFMLIEAETEDGQKALVVRGLNPQQSIINRLDVAQFFESIRSYVSDVASKIGAVPAIVIDDHSGGSGTNRPVLFGYMQAVRPKLTKVALKDTSEQPTKFNGYDIRQVTYALNQS